MRTFEFYIWDDSELYTWEANSWEEALTEICDDFDIEPTDIENYRELTNA